MQKPAAIKKICGGISARPNIDDASLGPLLIHVMQRCVTKMKCAVAAPILHSAGQATSYKRSFSICKRWGSNVLIILCLYFAALWLIFSRFKLIRWGWLSGTVSILVGALILATFLALFNYLTPSGRITVIGRVVEVTPNVTGQVIDIPVKSNAPVKIEGTGLIETIVWETKAGFALHVLNYTNPGAFNGYIREFYPIGEQRVTMTLPQGRQVSRVELLRAGKDIPVHHTGSTITFVIPSVLDYEIVGMYSKTS